MRPDYQPEMESCSTNVGVVLFYDTVVLGGRAQTESWPTRSDCRTIPLEGSAGHFA